MARLAACALLTLVAAVALSLRLSQLVPPRGGELVRVEQVVELGVLGVGAAVAWWLAIGFSTGASCALARLAGLRWTAGERFVVRHAPAVVRRAMSVSIGAGVGLAAAMLPAAALASEPPADLGWRATQAVTIAADTVVPASGPTSTGPAPTARPGPVAPSAPSSAELVTVAPGDTLWGIAARHLGAHASEAEIAASWPSWYATNRDVVGGDPDEIRPGQLLAVPVEPDSPTRGAETGAGS